MGTMRLNHVFGVLSLALVLSAPALSSEPMPSTPAGNSDAAGVVGRPLPQPALPPVAGTALAVPAMLPAVPPPVVPAGSIYVCMFETGDVRRETAIEFSPRVGALCAKHPEMGPCKYERNVCRGSGGRVYAAGGIEITLQMEADYDAKVMRVRIN